VYSTASLLGDMSDNTASASKSLEMLHKPVVRAKLCPEPLNGMTLAKCVRRTGAVGAAKPARDHPELVRLALSSFAALSGDSREQEVRALVELVRLSRVTLVIAEEGSDKSAVLRSMVMPLLQDHGGGTTKEIAVLFDWWKKVPLAVLKARIDEALARVVGDAAYAMEDHPSADRLSERLAARQRAFDCTFVIIFDRFEEYLAASAESDGIREFEAEFVEAVNSRTISANFVLSIDEHATSQLARLQEHITGLGDAQVRLSKVESERASLAKPHPEASADRLVGSQAPRTQAPTSETNVWQSDAPSREPFLSRTAERQGEMATAGEPIVASAEVDYERHDQVESPATVSDARDPIAARAAAAPRKWSWTRAAIALVIVLAIVSSLASLGIRRGGEPERGPIAAAVSPPDNAAQADAKAAQHENARITPDAPPPDGAVPTPEVHPAPAPQPQVAPDEPSSAASSDSPSVATPGPAARADAPRSPLLYINIGSEAQREYAEHIMAPLARHGIRVAGIRMVGAGPPVSDLRYFHSADRAEAVRINRALDAVGKPAQRLRHVPGLEDRQPRSQYELWLPPP
jgi:hypothetical protein